MRDEFGELVRKDPMMLYAPKNQAALEFHSSPAFIRYFRAGNRTSKTQSGYAEHYFATTGQHRWRHFPKPPNSTFIISGLGFAGYVGKVYEKKFLAGEEDNPLAPMFPEDGKWFYHYDARTYTITLACPECASRGKAQRCPGHHLKSQIFLFSNENGPGVIEGFVGRLGHIDEHVDEPFFNAVKMRLGSADHASFIITATPLGGFDSWENQILVEHILKGPPENNRYGAVPLVSLHEISQWDAGVRPHWKIKADMVGMDEFEIEARIFGRPAHLAKNPVFDRAKLTDMRKLCREPKYVSLHSKLPLEEVSEQPQLGYVEETVGDSRIWTGLRVWDMPVQNGQYIIAVDSASGLAPARPGRIPDASCASVLKIEPHGLKFKLKLVAQFWGWINPLDYGAEVFKLAVFYNSALVIVELTGGHGTATVLRLKELAYWNIFRELTPPDSTGFAPGVRLGVDTNAQTKPNMVGALQFLVKDKLIEVYCKDTIEEMVAFEQEDTGVGGSLLMTKRYRGAGGAKDDRVMSLCIGAGIAMSYPIYDFSQEPDTIQKFAVNEFESEDWKQVRTETKPQVELE